MIDKKESTLIINYVDARCSACTKFCDFREEEHNTMWDMYTYGSSGCGAKYTSVSTQYYEDVRLVDEVQKLRPDLPWKEYIKLVEEGWKI